MICQRLGKVHQVILSQVAEDDVLLDVDKVIDAGAGFHVLDGFGIHLIPGRGLKLNLDAGQCLELGSQHISGVIGRGSAF
jgi:hypothetical protein